MKWFHTAAISLSLLVVSGCASITGNDEPQWLYPPMAVPLQAGIQQEVQIARLTQLLQRADLSDQVRAKMFYERGSYYDSVGLKDLARLDYDQSLSLEPAQPELYNLLGVYYTQVGEFDAAYDSFDSALELDPQNSYAARNRAVALYYGDRIHLAIEDITKHYEEDPSDPFRALWLYIIKSEQDPKQARAELEQSYQERDDQWGWLLVAITLHDVNDDQVFNAILQGTRDNTLLAQRLTEAYFYLAKRYQQEGDYAQALSLYKLVLSFNVYEYVEHRYALLELSRIYHTVRDEQKQQQGDDNSEQQ